MADENPTGNGSMHHNGAQDSGAHTSQRQEQPDHRRSQNSGPRITNGAGSAAIEHSNPQVQHDAAYYRGFLGQLLDVVGSQDDATVSRMIALIRSGAPQQDIWAALSQLSQLSAEENGSRNRRASRGGGNSGEENEGRRR